MRDEDVEGGDDHEVEDGEQDVADRVLQLEEPILHVVVLGVVLFPDGEVVLLVRRVELHDPQSHVLCVSPYFECRITENRADPFKG